MAVGFSLIGVAEARAQLAGRCFDSSFGPWEPIEGTHTLPSDPPPPPGPEHETQLFPPRLLLDGRPFHRDRRWNRVEVPDGALPVPRPYRIWRLEADTLRVSLTDGFTGSRGRFVIEGERWTGTVEYAIDNGGVQRYDRDAALVEVDCTSEPPIPASADPPSPRAVPGDSGPPLELGEPLPEIYRVTLDPRFRAGGPVIGFVPAGVWDGADLVRVHFGPDDRISEIELIYPEGFSMDDLAEALIGEFGAGDPASSWLMWRNHSTRTFLRRSGRPDVVLLDTTLGRE